ncbi:MAG: S1 RNA-binding domain-containing protein [Bacillota bacterium]|jgi:S1 RNA binding domain protein
MALEVGAIVSGSVTGITNFGAFVELETGETGLVHISEVADAYVKDINDYLKLHDRITVKVINIDSRGKIGLSIRQAKRRPTVSLDEQLARFMKESEERLSHLRKNTDSKRGGRGGYSPRSSRQPSGGRGRS